MKYRLILLLLSAYISVFAQEEREQPTVQIGGFIKYDLFLDTYESVDTRDGMLYFFPQPKNLDAEGRDLNKNFQLEMLALTTRLNMSISGPTILGAETKGYIEGDFFGTSQDFTRLIRLRHAYFTFTWPNNLEVLMGQYWHPMFVTESFANPLTYAVALPFHVLNRSAQLRFSYPISSSFSIVSAFLVHGYHNSKGPREAQRNSGLPDSQLQLKFSQGPYFIALTGGYKFLKPRTITDEGLKTDAMANGFNVGASLKASYDAVTLKGGAVFGENLTHFIMIGGYGADQDPEITDDYGYSNMQSYSFWSDMHTNGQVRVGFLAGYTGNLGSKEPYYSLGYGRGEDLSQLYTLSPRVSYYEKGFSIGFEYKYTAAYYGTAFDDHYKVTDTAEPTANSRFLISARYRF